MQLKKNQEVITKSKICKYVINVIDVITASTQKLKLPQLKL